LRVTCRLLGALEDALGDAHGVGALLLRERERHRRVRLARLRPFDARPAAETDARDGFGLARAVDDARHVAQVGRPARIDADDELGHLVARAEERPGEHDRALVAAREGAGLECSVRGLQRADDLERRQPVGGERVGIELDPHLARQPAEHGALGDLLDLLEPRQQLLGHAPQRGVVRRLRPQGQRDDWNVVDLDRTHDPAGDAGRRAVAMRLDAAVDADQRAFAVLADEETHRDHRAVAARDRVDVLDAVDLPQELLQRRGDELLDLFGARARERDQHVGHGHDDLRFFFARRDEHGHPTEQRRHDQHQRRQRSGGERADQAPHPAVRARVVRLHHAPPLARPTVSPPAKPESTSTVPSASTAPVVTMRRVQRSPSSTVTVSI
jgi:hypothetical protein